MSDFDVKEIRFEQDIEEYLTTKGGYIKGNPKSFNRELGLDKTTFISFLKDSQPKTWERYEKIYGADSEKQVIERFCREVKMVGLLRVLRQGFTDRGINLKPSSGNRKQALIPLRLISMNQIFCTVQDSCIIL